jgi:hypothetical protein
MGRKLYRVPIDFDAPLGKVWEGYVSPEWRPCPANCEHGSTPAMAWIHSIVYLLTMLPEAAFNVNRPIHPWLQQVALAPKQRPGKDIVEFTIGLCGRAPSFFGHDAVDQWHAQDAIIKAAGLSEDWGTCQTCHGHAIHPDDIAASEAWEETEPPQGPGYQLWGTTSEGEPMSPVFNNLNDLCTWCEYNATTFADATATAEEWKSMLSKDFVYHKEGNNIFI